jgi:hypothetical protein
MTQPHPSNTLMNLIVTFIAPIFLGVTNGDLTLARMAAIETVNAYTVRNQSDLVAVAQIIASGLAALSSLCLSMGDDISLSMLLRLRGNAVALNRSAEQNRRVLRQPLPDNPTPYLTVMTPEPEPPAPPRATQENDSPDPSNGFLTPEAAQLLAAESSNRLSQIAEQTVDSNPGDDPAITEKRHNAMWAIAMVKESGEIAASIPDLSPAERNAASIRVAALGSAANELLTGARSPPSSFPGN